MKRLIVCCDGTWQSEDEGTPSNVWKLYRLIADADHEGTAQWAFYQSGVGTNPSSSALMRWVSRVAGGAFGWGLNANIEEIYAWLIREFEPGDQVWLFGFSRGAYTARSVAGLLRNCGILRSNHIGMIDRAMRLYRARGSTSHPNAPQSTSFRRNYAHELPAVEFLGVWDTVGSLGIPTNSQLLKRWFNSRYQFHDVQLSSRVRYAQHALAIDEQRRAFQPTLWKSASGELDQRDGVEQVWFAGVHTDIGGGYDDAGLSDIALLWMMDKARDCGLVFRAFGDGENENPHDLPKPTPDPMGALHDSRWFVHRVLGLTVVRPIVRGHRQFIHPAAIERLEKDQSYQPPNLEQAIEHGVPVAE